MLVHSYVFEKACAVWQDKMEREMNMTLLFKAAVPKRKNVRLLLACSTGYIVFVNGTFVATGPARTAHGFHRVDELVLTDYLEKKENVVSIHVNGANVHSYCHADHASFLCAEIRDDQTILAYTSVFDGGFVACSYEERVKRVPRYSEQRLFSEVYRLSSESGKKDTDMQYGELVSLCEISHGQFISRDVFYADYEPLYAKNIISRGKVSVSEEKEVRIPIYYKEAVYRHQCEGRKFPYVAYPMKDTEILPAVEAQKLCFTESQCMDRELLNLNYREYADVDFGFNVTGLVSFSVDCSTDTKLFLLFDEIMSEDGQIDFMRLSSSNVLIWELEKGHYDLITSEPYTMRFLRCVCMTGGCVLHDIAIKRVGFPKIERKLLDTDDRLQAVYAAAIETFRQNTYDIYMDCPSRERAGWLCDSFFTARAEYTLTGRCDVEKVFLTNFLLPDQLPFHPKGMLPMAYPSEMARIRFIPNWAMWYVLELEEYLQRSDDRELVKEAESRIKALLKYFRSFENEFGLLENLESWVFVEWSQANKLVQDVNFPTNMLYARFKRALANLYEDDSLLEEAVNLEHQIRMLSQDGLFFCDNAVRENGKLVLSGEHTETCQYYAFFCGIASPKTHADLWNTMLTQFGPEKTDKYPDVYPSNAFIGHYLRLDLLASYGEHERLLENIKGYFYKMACRTGTLWEYDTERASCCHGFASSIVYWLDKLEKLS